jgi:formylmethanofuran dehydrogenase subunit E
MSQDEEESHIFIRCHYCNEWIDERYLIKNDDDKWICEDCDYTERLEE